jgi:hypothetical protein
VEFRAFAAEKLTNDANDWNAEHPALIMKQKFMDGIFLEELSVDSGGNFEAYYCHGGMFLGGDSRNNH